MKRCVAALLALMLLVSALALSAADGMIAVDYHGLKDKLYRQIQLGSGFRGVVRLTFEGGAEWAEPFMPLSGALIRFQTVTDRQGHTEFESMISKNGTNTAFTRLWSDGTWLYLRSDLLIDTLLRYPWKGDILSSLTAGAESNPNYLTAVFNALIHADNWNTVTAPLNNELENWVMRYAEAPVQVTENGRTLLRIHYQIPASDMKAEMKNLLRIALNDEDIYRQVKLYLTEDQLLLGFSGENLAYEDRVIDTLPITGGVEIERMLTTRGETVSLTVTMPLTGGLYGWTELELREENGETSLRLRGGEHPVFFTVSKRSDDRDSMSWGGKLELSNSDGELVKASWEADRSFSQIVDANYSESEVVIWNLRITPDADSEAAFDPITAHLRFYLYSAYGNTSTTTVEIDGSLEIAGEQITLTAKLNDTAPWTATDMDTTGWIDATALSDERRQGIRNDLLTNALLTLAMLDGAQPTPGPTEGPAEEIPVLEEVTATPTPEPALTPTPKLTETPAPTATPKPTETPVPTATPTPQPQDETIEFVDLDEEDG